MPETPDEMRSILAQAHEAEDSPVGGLTVHIPIMMKVQPAGNLSHLELLLELERRGLRVPAAEKLRAAGGLATIAQNAVDDVIRVEDEARRKLMGIETATDKPSSETPASRWRMLEWSRPHGVLRSFSIPHPYEYLVAMTAVGNRQQWVADAIKTHQVWTYFTDESTVSSDASFNFVWGSTLQACRGAAGYGGPDQDTFVLRIQRCVNFLESCNLVKSRESFTPTIQLSSDATPSAEEFSLREVRLNLYDVLFQCAVAASDSYARSPVFREMAADLTIANSVYSLQECAGKIERMAKAYNLALPPHLSRSLNLLSNGKLPMTDTTKPDVALPVTAAAPSPATKAPAHLTPSEELRRTLKELRERTDAIVAPLLEEKNLRPWRNVSSREHTDARYDFSNPLLSWLRTFHHPWIVTYVLHHRGDLTTLFNNPGEIVRGVDGKTAAPEIMSLHSTDINSVLLGVFPNPALSAYHAQRLNAHASAVYCQERKATCLYGLPELPLSILPEGLLPPKGEAHVNVVRILAYALCHQMAMSVMGHHVLPENARRDLESFRDVIVRCDQPEHARDLMDVTLSYVRLAMCKYSLDVPESYLVALENIAMDLGLKEKTPEVAKAVEKTFEDSEMLKAMRASSDSRDVEALKAIDQKPEKAPEVKDPITEYIQTKVGTPPAAQAIPSRVLWRSLIVPKHYIASKNPPSAVYRLPHPYLYLVARYAQPDLAILKQAVQAYMNCVVYDVGEATHPLLTKDLKEPSIQSEHSDYHFLHILAALGDGDGVARALKRAVKLLPSVGHPTNLETQGLTALALMGLEQIATPEQKAAHQLDAFVYAICHQIANSRTIDGSSQSEARLIVHDLIKNPAEVISLSAKVQVLASRCNLTIPADIHKEMLAAHTVLLSAAERESVKEQEPVSWEPWKDRSRGDIYSSLPGISIGLLMFARSAAELDDRESLMQRAVKLDYAARHTTSHSEERDVFREVLVLCDHAHVVIPSDVRLNIAQIHEDNLDERDLTNLCPHRDMAPTFALASRVRVLVREAFDLVHKADEKTFHETMVDLKMAGLAAKEAGWKHSAELATDAGVIATTLRNRSYRRIPGKTDDESRLTYVKGFVWRNRFSLPSWGIMCKEDAPRKGSGTEHDPKETTMNDKKGTIMNDKKVADDEEEDERVETKRAVTARRGEASGSAKKAASLGGDTDGMDDADSDEEEMGLKQQVAMLVKLQLLTQKQLAHDRKFRAAERMEKEQEKELPTKKASGGLFGRLGRMVSLSNRQKEVVKGAVTRTVRDELIEVVREPLLTYLRKKFGNKFDIAQPYVIAFMETEAGESLIAGVIGYVVPNVIEFFTDEDRELAREIAERIRVEMYTHATHKVVSPLWRELRKPIVDAIRPVMAQIKDGMSALSMVENVDDRLSGRTGVRADKTAVDEHVTHEEMAERGRERMREELKGSRRGEE